MRTPLAGVYQSNIQATEFQRLIEILDAALAERGRVERERAAKIAEGCWADRCDIADDIRNQTGN